MKQHSLTDVTAVQSALALMIAIAFCIINLFAPAFCTAILETLSGYVSSAKDLDTIWQEFLTWFASVFSA